jgi:hypothetical protein
MATRRYLGAIAGALLLGAQPAAAIDNLSCFKATDSSPKGRFPTVLGGPLSPKTCTLKTPAKIACVATHGTSITPAPPDQQSPPVDTNFLCYQARCSGPPAGSAELTDMLAAHQVRLRGARLICLPAQMTGGITPATTTTTLFGATTTTTPSGNCHFADGRCTGTCAAGSRCGTAAGSADCQCRSVSCGDADAPECDGACTSAGEACVFDVTGCSCVRVP